MKRGGWKKGQTNDSGRKANMGSKAHLKWHSSEYTQTWFLHSFFLYQSWILSLKRFVLLSTRYFLCSKIKFSYNRLRAGKISVALVQLIVHTHSSCSWKYFLYTNTILWFYKVVISETKYQLCHCESFPWRSATDKFVETESSRQACLIVPTRFHETSLPPLKGPDVLCSSGGYIIFCVVDSRQASRSGSPPFRFSNTGSVIFVHGRAKYFSYNGGTATWRRRQRPPGNSVIWKCCCTGACWQ